jgi:hypothetical protein
VASAELGDLVLEGLEAGPAVASSMVPFSNAVKYRWMTLVWPPACPG